MLLGDVGEVDNHNLFAYCYNNPMMYSNPDGYEPSEPWEGLADWFIVVGTAAAAIQGVIINSANIASNKAMGVVYYIVEISNGVIISMFSHNGAFGWFSDIKDDVFDRYRNAIDSFSSEVVRDNIKGWIFRIYDAFGTADYSKFADFYQNKLNEIIIVIRQTWKELMNRYGI